LPNNADIQPGDLLITSGLGGTFPQGYPVAVVDEFTPEPNKPFASITATPKAMLNRNRELMIVWSNTTPIPLTSQHTANDKKTETPAHE
jgi:rod shape-determining protein MreC